MVFHVSLARRPERAHFSRQDTYDVRETRPRGEPTGRWTDPRRGLEAPGVESPPGAARDPTWEKWVPRGPQGLRAPGGGATRATRAPRGHAGTGELLAGHFLAGFFFAP